MANLLDCIACIIVPIPALSVPGARDPQSLRPLGPRRALDKEVVLTTIIPSTLTGVAYSVKMVIVSAVGPVSNV